MIHIAIVAPEEDILGDAWQARLKREHERHAGLPTAAWWCPYFDRPKPVVPLITDAMIREMRASLAGHVFLGGKCCCGESE